MLVEAYASDPKMNTGTTPIAIPSSMDRVQCRAVTMACGATSVPLQNTWTTPYPGNIQPSAPTAAYFGSSVGAPPMMASGSDDAGGSETGGASEHDQVPTHANSTVPRNQIARPIVCSSRLSRPPTRPPGGTVQRKRRVVASRAPEFRPFAFTPREMRTSCDGRSPRGHFSAKFEDRPACPHSAAKSLIRGTANTSTQEHSSSFDRWG